MPSFIVEPLSPSQIHAVFPLIREAMPGIGLKDWVRFARTATGARRGVMVARRLVRDLPCGLFCYRIQSDPVLGRILAAEHFVAIDLLDPGAVIAALVRELEALGQRFGCSAVRSHVHGADAAGGLASAGHAPSGSLLLKSLTSSA